MTASDRKTPQPKGGTAHGRHERPQKTLAERVAAPGHAGAKIVAAGLIGTATLALPAATAWAATDHGATASPHAEPTANSAGATPGHSGSPATAELTALTTAGAGTGGPAANTQLARGLFPEEGPPGNPVMKQDGYSDFTLPSGFSMKASDGSFIYVTPEGTLLVAAPGGNNITRQYAPGSEYQLPDGSGKIVVPGPGSDNDPTGQNSDTKTASVDGSDTLTSPTDPSQQDLWQQMTQNIQDLGGATAVVANSDHPAGGANPTNSGMSAYTSATGSGNGGTATSGAASAAAYPSGSGAAGASGYTSAATSGYTSGGTSGSGNASTISV